MQINTQKIKVMAFFETPSLHKARGGQHRPDPTLPPFHIHARFPISSPCSYLIIEILQTNFTTGVRGSLHTNKFLTRLESLGVKNKNTREAIRNRTVQKTLSMSDMILKFFFIALNSKKDWTLQNLPTEIVNKNMERFNLHIQPPRL